MKIPVSVSFDEELLAALKTHVASLRGRDKTSLSQWICTACEERLAADASKPGEDLLDLIDRLGDKAESVAKAKAAQKTKQGARRKAA